MRNEKEEMLEEAKEMHQEDRKGLRLWL